MFWLICVFFLFLFYVGNQNVGNALSCAGPITTQSSYENSDVVFFGEVISKEYTPSSIRDQPDSLVKFKIKESFKGITNDTLTITTSEYLWSAIFDEGNEYVVFASVSDGVLRDTLCTLNGGQDHIDFEQIRKLSEKEAPTKEPANENILSPKQQIKTGILPEDTICKEDFELIFKSTDNSPACVKPSTALKLVERGWAQMPSDVKSIEIISTNIIEANNQFAIDLYSQMSKDNDENIFFSPWSISTAFAIAYEGAIDNTADEMRKVFEFPTDDEQRRSEFNSINDDLDEKNAYKLQIANALWLAEGFEPNSEYVNIAKTYYDSQVSNVNFITDEGVKTINEWVREKTEDKIEKIFEPGSTDETTRLAITNAIYFKGSWMIPFNENQTQNADFMVNSNKTITVPMMHLLATTFNYTENEQLEILQLPYEGNKISMLILLPKDVDGIGPLEDSLTIENLATWKSHLYDTRIGVTIPKFILETDYDLTKKLPDLGMRDAFDPDNADFSGIHELEKLFISQAVHKAFVDVNEEGTEAAAVTGIGLAFTSLVLSFEADHPFILLIQENETGNILFIGRVMEPKNTPL